MKQTSYFNISWWSMILEAWFWSKSQSLTFQCTIDFSSVDWNSFVNPMVLRSDLNYEIWSRWFIWILDIMFQTNKSCIRSKFKNQVLLVKTLIFTILPFWWFDQFSWGVVIPTWSIDTYEFKMFMLTKDIEVWVYVDHSWLFTQYRWF